jgi:hypothetical protein
MALFTRRERPPAEIIALLPAAERIVSWADTDGGAVVAATPVGLWWPSADGPRRIGWQYIDKAVWRGGVLTVIEAEVVDDLLLVDRPAVSVRLTTPRDLPPTVRKRVENNIVRSELHPVSGATARIPGRDGLVWWVRLDAQLRADERIRAEVQDRVDALRAADTVDQLW